MKSYYNNYPAYIPILRTTFNVSLVTTGLITLLHVNIWIAVLYILYCFCAALIIMPKLRCTKCYYHKGLCSTGFSLIAQRLHKNSSNKPFKSGAWHNIFLIPIAFIPIGGGIYLLFSHCSTKNMILLSLVLLSFAAILIEHGCLGCYNCKELEQCIAGKVVKRQQD
ncbi:MAG: hypothetical protein ACMUIP_01500 [bacterium]